MRVGEFADGSNRVDGTGIRRPGVGDDGDGDDVGSAVGGEPLGEGSHVHALPMVDRDLADCAAAEPEDRGSPQDGVVGLA